VEVFRFVSGLFFGDLVFSTIWPALFSGLFLVCFCSSFVFNNFQALFLKIKKSAILFL